MTQTHRTIVSRSPGRINLIGEHTDYNNGFVLPAAIDKAAYVRLTLRNDDQIKLISRDFNATYGTTLGTIAPTDKGWPNYLLGVVDQLLGKGTALTGFEAELWGDVPAGAGLSSSAAVECAMLIALNEAFHLNMPRMTMAQTAQAAEHAFAGVKVGIMDPFASLFGKEGHVIRLDCRSLQYEYVPFHAEGYRLVLCDSGVHHSLASSEYNVRRQQCEAGVAEIKQRHPEVQSLRDVTTDMLKYITDPLIKNRCRYVVEENDRLLKGCEDLERDDLKAFGEKMYKTHDGLSKLYEVSCPELDFLVEKARPQNAVLGARMMGGGFGGCTLNLVETDKIDDFRQKMTTAYKTELNKDLKVYVANIGNGGSIQ
ncbi:MAG TPA: galactokinase [Dinghuibacter sp.]|uniref:galactokinase n=1 Tax=Dinghuibacter sp. TaxID=2024697 RepID=UPI002C7D5846|nr:galactokinase [Dinghuibacter sp.]HTJ14296.1 galactokinase [Dinghuibacter sp.]